MCGMMADISERTKNLGTETAFSVLAEVNERLKKGQDIISFCIGQPDFDTPENIKEAAIKAIKAGKSGYTASAGIPELRQAAADYFKRSRKIDADANDVVIACGGKPFIGYTIGCVTDHGKGHEVIYPNPGYPIYESQIRLQGAVKVPMPLLEKNKFSLDVETLKEKISKNTKMIILNSPHNPTGSILADKDLKAIADLAIDHDLWVYSDEVYSTLVYDTDFKSIASIDGMYERTVVVDCASKMFAMTGWRLGYCANRKLAAHIARWVTNTDSCAPHATQWAVAEGLNGPDTDIKKMKKSFHERRDLIYKLLNDIDGISAVKPGGAFYIWPNVTKACKKAGAKDAEDFRKILLDKAKVAVVSDIHFGGKNPGQNEEYIRFSYATSKDGIKAGLKRVKEFVESY